MHLSTLEKYLFLYTKFYDAFLRSAKKQRLENTQNAKKKEKKIECDLDRRAFQRLVEEFGNAKTPPRVTKKVGMSHRMLKR